MTETTCECGWKVKGISEKHLESNLKEHKNSKIHKILMEVRRQNGRPKKTD